MLHRCQNPNAKDFKNYGERGIKVCERWSASFAAFLEDMGEKPDGLTLERKENSGNYEPGNCRWATRGDQNNNTRVNRLLTFNGKTLTAAQWGRRLGISPHTIRQRLQRGASDAEALNPSTDMAETRRRNGWAQLIAFAGESLTTFQWAERTGIGTTTIGMRIKAGWSPERALTTPARRKRK